jgi:hypothetical protein
MIQLADSMIREGEQENTPNEAMNAQGMVFDRGDS